MKQFVFSIDSEEIIVHSNSLWDAVEHLKEKMKVNEIERDQWKKIKFIGIKY
ncbi:hypothetical protein [Bacillus sp. SA1-12]|uniref:hypothetical protein n=1 Tax=Bacillus sp. SA1-12 TaxID=1455638 RepID=UPI000AD680FE|nr:hypothetical protein [Bacillus sp. SA1-12]